MYRDFPLRQSSKGAFQTMAAPAAPVLSVSRIITNAQHRESIVAGAVRVVMRIIYDIVCVVKARQRIEHFIETSYGFDSTGPFITQGELDHYKVTMTSMWSYFGRVENHEPHADHVNEAVFLQHVTPLAVLHAVRRFRHRSMPAPCGSGCRELTKVCLCCTPELAVAMFFLTLTDRCLQSASRIPGLEMVLTRAGVYDYKLTHDHAHAFFPHIGIWEFEPINMWRLTEYNDDEDDDTSKSEPAAGDGDDDDDDDDNHDDDKHMAPVEDDDADSDSVTLPPLDQNSSALLPAGAVTPQEMPHLSSRTLWTPAPTTTCVYTLRPRCSARVLSEV